MLAERADPLLVTVNDAFGGFARIFRGEIGELAGEIGRDILGADSQHNCVRCEAIERAIGIDNVLDEGIEIANVNVEVVAK